MVYFPIEWKGGQGDAGRETGRKKDQRRRAMMEPSVHRDPRIINIDDLRPLFGPDGAPLLRAIAPVYEPAGRPTTFLSLFLFLYLSLFVFPIRVSHRDSYYRSTNAFSVTRDVTI